MNSNLSVRQKKFFFDVVVQCNNFPKFGEQFSYILYIHLLDTVIKKSHFKI